MDSVRLNNTVQEGWKTRPDTGHQWSHCAVAPLYIAYQGLAGIRPLAPGFKRLEIRPQLVDLEQLDLVAHTVRGPLRFHAHGRLRARELTVDLPPGSEGELVLPLEEHVTLQRATDTAPPGHVRYRLPTDKRLSLRLAFC